MFLELNENIVNLVKRNNDGSNIGVSEIISCWCYFGEAMNKLRMYYHKNGFPKNDGVVLSKLWALDPLATSCRFALRDLEKSAFINDSEFLDQGFVGDLFFELLCSCCSGDYEYPANSNIAKLKKVILCELMDMAYDYWYGSSVDSKCFYIDNARFEKLQEYYQVYKDYVGPQCKNYKADENGLLVCVYEGPQFGNEIENLFEYLNKEYKISDTPKKLEKK